MTWLPYKGHCYAIVKRRESWSAASRICTTRGANLVSILDTMESTFIERCLRLFGDRYNNYWIGLFKTHAGHWLWLDKSVMDYTNWMSSNEYHDYGGLWFKYSNTPCVTIIESKWSRADCDTDLEFICKREKGLPAILPTAPPTETVHSGEAETLYVPYGAVSVAGAVAVLFLLAGLTYMFHRCFKRHAASSTYDEPVYYRMEGPLQEETDTRARADT